MELLKQNSKMKNSSNAKTFNFGITAVKNCPNAKSCARGCYATQGRFVFQNIKDAYETRSKISRMESFSDLMQLEIERAKPLKIRIHDSGDFYSKEYLEKWLEIARRNPNLEFYAYTKMISLIKSTQIPENMTLIFSFGGKEDALIDKKTDRHARVFTTRKELLSEGYADASKDDAVALRKNKKIGLIYRGSKNKNFTIGEKK